MPTTVRHPCAAPALTAAPPSSNTAHDTQTQASAAPQPHHGPAKPPHTVDHNNCPPHPPPQTTNPPPLPITAPNAVSRNCTPTHATLTPALTIRQAPRPTQRWIPYNLDPHTPRPTHGHAPGTRAALARAHTHTIICDSCDSLVDLQHARRACRLRSSTTLAPTDGCVSCSGTGRRGAWTLSQAKMARGVLSEERVLVTRPNHATSRTTLTRTAPATAKAHALWILQCLDQPPPTRV